MFNTSSIDYQTRKVFNQSLDARDAARDYPHFGEPTTLAQVAAQIAREERELQHYIKVAQYKRTQKF